MKEMKQSDFLGGIIKKLIGIAVALFAIVLLLDNGSFGHILGHILEYFPFAKFVVGFVEDVVGVSSGINIPTSYTILEDSIRLMIMSLISSSIKWMFTNYDKSSSKFIVDSIIEIITAVVSTKILGKFFTKYNSIMEKVPIIGNIILILIILGLFVLTVVIIKNRAISKGRPLKISPIGWILVDRIVVPATKTLFTTACVCYAYIKLTHSNIASSLATLMTFIIVMAIIDYIYKFCSGESVQKK